MISQIRLKPIKLFLAAILLSIFSIQVKAQDQFQSITFRIDSLAGIGLPKSALAEVDKLEKAARETHNAAQQVRAVIYRMAFQSYIEEDALVAIIIRLRQDMEQADYPVKPVLQSLLAGIYWNYYQQNRYQFGQRSRLEKPGNDITKWDLQTIIGETTRLYKLSLADDQKEQSTPVSVLDGVLTGNKATRYLRPTFYDLLLHSALDFLLADEAGLTKPKLPFSLNDKRFFGNSEEFSHLRIAESDTASTVYQGIKFLQQATLFHLQKKNNEALADLDLKRLEFLHLKATITDKDSLYLDGLKQIAQTFADEPINADALVLIGKYYQQKESLLQAIMYLEKAKITFPKSVGGANAVILLAQIRHKELSAQVEDPNVPGKPLLAIISYRNVKRAAISVYHLTEDQDADLFKPINGYERSDRRNSDSLFSLLKKLKPEQEIKLSLPGTDDFNAHSAEFKLNPLPAGHYVLLAKDSTGADSNLTQTLNFRITRLSYITRQNPDGRIEVRVMDRENGRPVKDVNVGIGSGLVTDFTVKTDTNGACWFTRDLGRYSIRLTLPGDTVYTGDNYFGGNYNNSRNEEAPEDHTIIFTDRQLYRPGQVIYFKALQFRTTKGKSAVIQYASLGLYFYDANQQKISSLMLQTNEYGSVSGSFTIPQTTLNGGMRISTLCGQVYVRVEEYKRPSFQVIFSPVTKNYRLNDSVTVKGRVEAFSGYGLSQARVAYHVTGITNYRIYRPNQRSETEEVKTDTIVTSSTGDFTFKFKAPLEASAGDNSKIYSYSVSADVTDADGETHSGETVVSVGNNPLVLETAVTDRMLTKDISSITVNLHNINGQSQAGALNLKVYALKKPGHLYKERLWQKPNQFLLGKDEFEKSFPDYAYHNEDEYGYREIAGKVIDQTLTVTGQGLNKFNLEQVKANGGDIYKFIFSARNAEGDTVSTTMYSDIIDTSSPVENVNDWVVPYTTVIKQGGQAAFLAGRESNGNILMEVGCGSKLISSRWLSPSGTAPQMINIGDPLNEQGIFYVQFLMVSNNRMYTQNHVVYVKANDDDSLRIKLVTYRNKMQPGEKEQWKLQLSKPGNEKFAAEVVAAMYDASLDQIARPNNWTNYFGISYSPNNPYLWINNMIAFGLTTQPLAARYNDYRLITRSYERLNTFGFNYYGQYNYGYREYLNDINTRLGARAKDKQQEKEYAINASRVKNGYDISGYIKDADDGLGLPGVTVKIKGTAIAITTNSWGYFRIKVPVNGTLLISYTGYETKEVATNKSARLDVELEQSGGELGDMVVIGDGVQKRMDITSSVSSVNEGYFKSTPGASVNVMLRGRADAEVRIRGTADANNVFTSVDEISRDGVRIRNGKRVPGNSDSNPVTIRKNFNETAFFYPQLHTDEKGEIQFEFTMPEALTQWRFKAFGHTKEMQTGYTENTVVTQKELSISANMPRFLREGDTLTVSARLSNLTGGQLKGKINLQLFNALNMQPVHILADPADAQQSFKVAAATNKAVAFRIIIPPGLDALTYRLTAEAGNFSDGEENTLPVLPNRMLVTESMPMMVRSGQTRTFTFDKLVNQRSATLKNKILTLEYTQNPAWYAVQALPYMMEFPYECSEQIFSRYYANSLATNLVNHMPVIKKVFDEWKTNSSTELLSNLEKNQELKSTLLEETPWLRDAVNETEQKKRIALLFDLNNMSNELALNLDKLQKKQLANGAFPWFGGEYADRYITQHILAGFGQLYHSNIVDLTNEKVKEIADNAMSYLNGELIKDENEAAKVNKNYKTRPLSAIEIHAWYTKSYYTQAPMDDALKAVFNNYLSRAGAQWLTAGIYEQGMIALTMLRNGKTDIAKMIIRSLTETAQQSDEMGMYWGKNQLGYYWYQSPVETQSLMIELFTEAGNNEKAVEEMKIWLLRNKQTNSWQTTKATAAACYALLAKNESWLAPDSTSIIKLGGKPLEELRPDVKADAGTGYIKTSWADEQVKSNLGRVDIINKGKSISWGALHWQYLEQLDKITPSNTDIHLERKYFILKQTGAGPVLTAVDATHQPKTGDVLKVVVYLKAGRDFEYVQLKDMRPAGTEPVDALSTWKYQDGLYYYQVTKDVATNFFISNLNKGNYVFEYQLRVEQPGRFSTGITTVQSMYAPEFNAHAQGMRISFGQ